jgi:hypothetical protein
MTAADNLKSLELLRDFVRQVVPIETYMRNLVISGAENINKRLWTLRTAQHMGEMEFARKLGMSKEAYEILERYGTHVTEELLQDVSTTFSVSIAWLRCEKPMYPIV